MTLALDGELISDPLLEPIEPASEVHFIPRIGGAAERREWLDRGAAAMENDRRKGR